MEIKTSKNAQNPSKSGKVIIANNFILIGAADRNVGKTELACFLIKKVSKTQKVIGLKVTTVNEMNGKCPRGGIGCGACSSLQGNYCIYEEVSKKTNKDTSKMLNAGATSVFWIRSLHNHLDSAWTEST